MSEPFAEDELRIDDLGFADLLRLALEDVPGASQGRWTLHGPVDPGVTLLEQFAWQLEQRLFMAEQTTGAVALASLRLLGVALPAATVPARTVLCLTGPGPAVGLPAGTVLLLDGDRTGRRVSLDDPVTVLPVGPLTVSGRLGAVGDTLELAHGHVGPSLVGSRLSVLVDVAAAPGVEPAWSPEAATVAPAGALRWTAVGRDGSEAEVAVDDSTGGFRRSGLLRLDWPRVWDALGGQPCRLRATLTSGRLTEAVVVRGAYANAATASDRVAEVDDVTGQLGGLLPLPGQRLRVDGTAGRLLDGPGAVSVTWVERTASRTPGPQSRTGAPSAPTTGSSSSIGRAGSSCSATVAPAGSRGRPAPAPPRSGTRPARVRPGTWGPAGSGSVRTDRGRR